MSLLAELKRRNVIRMAGLYLVGAWLLVQVAGTVLPWRREKPRAACISRQSTTLQSMFMLWRLACFSIRCATISR